MRLPLPTRAEVMVDSSSADDAGVYRLSDDLALVQTLDFFTPIVDDPATWGRIAATNALSDVWAMGGRPVTALNIVAWPRAALGWELLGEVLDGAASVLGRRRVRAGRRPLDRRRPNRSSGSASPAWSTPISC